MESCLQLWPGSQMKAMACLWVILLEGWMEREGASSCSSLLCCRNSVEEESGLNLGPSLLHFLEG